MDPNNHDFFCKSMLRAMEYLQLSMFDVDKYLGTNNGWFIGWAISGEPVPTRVYSKMKNMVMRDSVRLTMTRKTFRRIVLMRRLGNSIPAIHRATKVALDKVRFILSAGLTEDDVYPKLVDEEDLVSSNDLLLPDSL